MTKQLLKQRPNVNVKTSTNILSLKACWKVYDNSWHICGNKSRMEIFKKVSNYHRHIYTPRGLEGGGGECGNNL